MQNERVKEQLVAALRRAATVLPGDVVVALEHARRIERSALAAAQLDAILKNVGIAREGSVPICQDTGVQTFFIEAGVKSPYLERLPELIEQAVAEATAAVPLRPNTVHPFTGENPGNNLGRFMPYLNWDLVPGDDVTIVLLPKGGGSENMSTLKMLAPGVGLKGIKQAVVDHVISCGGKPCPPTVVGVGIGGGADIALKLGKRAILRELGTHHPEPEIAALESELLELINMSGVGPMGVGGATTSLAVHDEYAYRHPASLPLGILIQCWADRRARVRLSADGAVEVN